MDIRCSFKGVLMPESGELPIRSNPIHRNPLCESPFANNFILRKPPAHLPAVCCKSLLIACCKRSFVAYGKPLSLW